ncbi:MAG: glycosyltransferase [Phycisphaerales bacterium]|nr:glycosyltransferase [Phycisphaerales bacterium]
MSDGPILILSASAGAGHMTAARAIEQALSRAAGDAAPAVEVIDVLQHTSGLFRTLYAGGYLAIVNRAPAAMGWLYEMMDRPGARVRDAIRIGVQNICSGRVAALLRERRPRLIINTHFLAAELVAQLHRKGALDCPQFTVTTDFETHRLWVQPPTERYFTATAEGKAYLASFGVAAEAVVVSGIPVRAEFEQAVDRAAARSRLGLPMERPIVLMLCGGFGVGPAEQVLTTLRTVPGRPQVVVICGNNEALRNRLARVARDDSRVTIHGFTNDMHLFMRAADAAVTKPGGLTASEALVSGLPLVILNPIPGQEARNSDYLLENGAAIKVNSLRLLAQRVGALLADPARIAALRAAAGRIARPAAAMTIANEALRFIGGGERGAAVESVRCASPDEGKSSEQAAPVHRAAS